MGNYLKPLRRKIGVVMLVMACMFMAGWVRSYFTYDFFALTQPMVLHQIGSYSGIVNVGRDWPLGENPERISGPLFSWNSGKAASIVGPKVGWDVGYDVLWNWQWNEFSCGAATRGHGHFEAATVPYWSIVLPLTLLSKWLLLSRPRKTKSASPA